MRHEVVESFVLEHKVTHARISPYGALPYGTAGDWDRVHTGYTVYNPRTGQYGVGRPPCNTREQAQALADRLGECSAIRLGD